jgi:hypothetical protein
VNKGDIFQLISGNSATSMKQTRIEVERGVEEGVHIGIGNWNS